MFRKITNWLRRLLRTDNDELNELAMEIVKDFPFVRDGSVWLGLDQEVGDPWVDRHAALMAVGRGDSAWDTLQHARRPKDWD